MEKHTHREYLVWNHYLDELEKNPSKDNWYIIQLTAEVRRLFAKRPKRIKLKDFILKFGRQKEKVLDPEEQLRQSKSFWMGALGMLKEQNDAGTTDSKTDR